jgi:hypothetical protein
LNGPAALAPVAAVGAFRTPWLKIIAVVLASRLLLFFVGLFTLYSHGVEAHLDWATWTDLSCRWDCGWYSGIVENGYGVASTEQPGATNWAFYPLLPLLVAGLKAVFVGADLRLLASGLSTGLLVLALAMIHRYARELGNSERVAATSVLIVAFLPHGIVFSSLYTESLFLFLLVGTMLSLRLQHYLLAGLCAALLSATRSNGIFIIVFILVQLWLQLGSAAFFRPWRNPYPFVALLMAPLGAFAYWTYAYYQTGDAFAMATTVRHGWAWSWEWPLGNFSLFWKTGTDARFWLLGSMFTGLCSLLMLRYRWYAEFAFCLVVFFLIWGGTVPNSLWRYSMVLFPAWIALARLLESRESMRMALFAAIGLVGGFVMHAWALQLKVTI